ncbi:MAG TPA: SUMF1/EgtB/PvdO family nonheme iron enzyme [Candidatus Paceibacterota bacterium]|nr:SUMF1/EgtB/PvdO family nonheme iron enzyme [Verrucomicrobiota bacterium]HRZ43727.1 SUMF1/EgtB/PvdO family nonheme iron enzyme [Candidatus Paceibacterota bacterium]
MSVWIGLIAAGLLMAAPGRALEGIELARYRLGTLEQAVHDLIRIHGTNYPNGGAFLDRMAGLRQRLDSGQTGGAIEADVAALQQEALLSNPILESRPLLVVKRRPARRAGGGPGLDIAMPSNHECNSSLARTGYDNELCVLSSISPRGELRGLYRPPAGGYVGEIDLHWDGDRLLFTQSDAANWKVFEMHSDGSGLRQVSAMPDDVDSFDACYLPNGKIIFGSTGSFQSVPCWHGLRRVATLYRMDADGSRIRQLCFDQDHDLHPTVLPSGQVLYHRWDYTGINHIYLRELMLMNPDGAGQRAIYGSGSWYPNALYFPRPLPEVAGQILCILSGYHGVHRMGQLVVIDTTRGWHEADGIVQRISGQGDPLQPRVKDNLVDADWPKFLHPYPLSEKQFLVAAWLQPKGSWGIYLADVFDNLVRVREEPGWALLEPVPLAPRPAPPIVPDQVDPSRRDGLVYLHDVHAGPGLKGVPRGTVKRLRVLAYHYGYPGLAGPDRIGYGGPWEVMRILGTVPIETDGSALFRVPANTPIALQPLDDQGQAVQLMRSWFTVMPGEVASCAGCHERPADAAARPALAARRPPRELTPWRGPARGFDFEREVQPVLDRHCVRCHDGSQPPLGSMQAQPLDLRPTSQVPNYAGRRISQMGIDRLHPQMLADTRGILKYAPAYDALIPYLRRVGIEDDVSLLMPGEYQADTSPLVQLLRKGHRGVALDAESWDRLVTWIDLNAPCHGTWGEVYPIPDGAHERRMALRRQFGGPTDDPEQIPDAPCQIPPRAETASATPADPAVLETPDDPPLVVRDEPLGRRTIPLGDGITLDLVRIPAGEFAMGDPGGEPDERPAVRESIPEPFWMGACEISNEQFRRFDPRHSSRYYAKRYPATEPAAPSYVGPGARGLDLDGDRQPAVRVSWDQAMAFCRWLSARTGLRFDLPTEAQWEWACRAGTRTPWSFGGRDTDFSRWANLADSSFGKGLGKDGKQITGGLEHLVIEGASLSDVRFNDGAVVTAETGRYSPNAWGVHDMHGNAAEWTRSLYGSYSRRRDPPGEDIATGSRQVVRGGSFFDPPGRSRSASRLAYPPWRRVFNVGFRVVCKDVSIPVSEKP